MDAFPPDRRRRDLDNIQKPVLDALQHARVYQDDSQVDLLVTRRCGPANGGRVDVRLDETPLRRCPLCGGAIPWEDN
jgi:crossover junction endodeoxyribonuclease RusA